MQGKAVVLQQRLLEKAAPHSGLDLEKMNSNERTNSGFHHASLLLRDIKAFGYIALKESLGHDSNDLNEACSEIARQYSLDNKRGLAGNAIVDPGTFLRLDHKKLGEFEAETQLPVLMMYFSTPQIDLYKAFHCTALGPELMEWLSIGESGTYEFTLLSAQTKERFCELTSLLFTRRLGKNASNMSFVSNMITAFGVTNLQHYLERGVDPIEAQLAAGKRLKSFLESVGLNPDSASHWTSRLRDYACFPYPALWDKQTPPMQPQSFLGLFERFEQLEGAKQREWWRKSAIAYYNSNSFFNNAGHPTKPVEFEYFTRYIELLQEKGVTDDGLCTCGVMEIIGGAPESVEPWAQRIEGLLAAHVEHGEIPEITHPVALYVLAKHTPDPGFAYLAYFESALHPKTSMVKSRRILDKLQEFDPQWLAEKIDSCMNGKPLASSCKKLLPLMENPAVYVQLLPPQLRVELLEADLGL